MANPLVPPGRQESWEAFTTTWTSPVPFHALLDGQIPPFFQSDGSLGAAVTEAAGVAPCFGGPAGVALVERLLTVAAGSRGSVMADLPAILAANCSLDAAGAAVLAEACLASLPPDPRPLGPLGVAAAHALVRLVRRDLFAPTPLELEILVHQALDRPLPALAHAVAQLPQLTTAHLESLFRVHSRDAALSALLVEHPAATFDLVRAIGRWSPGRESSLALMAHPLGFALPGFAERMLHQAQFDAAIARQLLRYAPGPLWRRAARVAEVSLGQHAFVQIATDAQFLARRELPPEAFLDVLSHPSAAVRQAFALAVGVLAPPGPGAAPAAPTPVPSPRTPV